MFKADAVIQTYNMKNDRDEYRAKQNEINTEKKDGEWAYWDLMDPYAENWRNHTSKKFHLLMNMIFFIGKEFQ